MFSIQFCDSQLKKKIAARDQFYPPEVCQELPQFLEALERDGDINGVDYYKGDIKKISAVTFSLYYVSNTPEKIVKLIDLKVKSAELLRERFTIEDSWDDKDVIPSIPQYDVPEKIIQALELIDRGVSNSYDLGYKLGHRGKQDRYISRHGQYAQHTLEQLKLIVRTQEGPSKIPELTEKGRLIAQAHNKDLKERLLIEAMLSYQPVWQIIGAVTEGEDDLNDGLIKHLAFPEEFHGADTSNRRSQTLKNWIKWISAKSGIPIRLHRDGVQLTIPLLYSNPEENH